MRVGQYTTLSLSLQQQYFWFEVPASVAPAIRKSKVRRDSGRKVVRPMRAQRLRRESITLPIAEDFVSVGIVISCGVSVSISNDFARPSSLVRDFHLPLSRPPGRSLLITIDQFWWLAWARRTPYVLGWHGRVRFDPCRAHHSTSVDDRLLGKLNVPFILRSGCPDHK